MRMRKASLNGIVMLVIGGAIMVGFSVLGMICESLILNQVVRSHIIVLSGQYNLDRKPDHHAGLIGPSPP